MISIQPNNSLLLLILIHVSVLLSQLRLQFPRIKKFLIMLPPAAHIPLIRHKLGRLAMVGFQEVNGFLPFREPEFVLGHSCDFYKIREAFAPRTANLRIYAKPFC